MDPTSTSAAERVPELPPAALDRRLYAFGADRAISWSLYLLAGLAAYRLSWADDDPWPGLALLAGTVLLVWLALGVAQGLTGTTPGRSLAGLRLVAQGTGAPVGVGPSLLRALVLGVATLPTLGLGTAMLAWTATMDPGRRRRGWHDHLVGAVVVDVRPAPRVPEPVVQPPLQVVNLTAMRLAPAPTAAPVDAACRPARPVPPTGAAGIGSDVQGEAEERTRVRGGATRPPTPRPPEAPAARPAVRWAVAFDTGRRLRVEGLVLVGRRPEPRAGEQVAHLVPLPSSDMSLSKTHAQVHPAADGALVVVDRGSTNGSVLVRQGVARELIRGRPTTVLDGDTVRFGDREMTVHRQA